MDCRQEDRRWGDWLLDYWINSGERCQENEQRYWQWRYMND